MKLDSSQSIIIQLFLVTCFVFSCNKYPDGPAFSLATKKGRLCNKWELQKIIVNGIARDSSFLKHYRIFIERDGAYSLSFKGPCCYEWFEAGTWEWADKKQEVKFKFKGDGPGANGQGFGVTPIYDGEHSLEIRRLKQNELWLKEVMVSGDVWEVHLKTHHPL